MHDDLTTTKKKNEAKKIRMMCVGVEKKKRAFCIFFVSWHICPFLSFGLTTVKHPCLYTHIQTCRSTHTHNAYVSIVPSSFPPSFLSFFFPLAGRLMTINLTQTAPNQSNWTCCFAKIFLLVTHLGVEFTIIRAIAITRSEAQPDIFLVPVTRVLPRPADGVMCVCE